MKTVEISDELYQELKAFIVDPFDDTAEQVISRLVQIANKAKDKWTPLEPPVQAQAAVQYDRAMAARTRMSFEEPQGPDQSQQVVL